jgi:hypothetical protein
VAVPLIIPKSVLPTTATLAGPPTALPAKEKAILLMRTVPPHFMRIDPKMMKSAISVADTPSGMPNIPPMERKLKSRIAVQSVGAALRRPGRKGATKG